MKAFKYCFVCIVFMFLGMNSYAQYVDIEDSSIPEDKNSKFEVEDRKSWPLCLPASGLRIVEERGEIVAYWDNPNNDSFEVSLLENENIEYRNSTITNQNYYTISSKERNTYQFFAIRRICEFEEELTVVSEWQKVALSLNDCNLSECEKFYSQISVGVLNNPKIGLLQRDVTITMPRNWDRIEVEYVFYRNYKAVGKSNVITGVYTYKKKSFVINRGERRVISIPENVSTIGFKNIYFTKNNIRYRCKDFGVVIPKDVNNCGNTIIYHEDPSIKDYNDMTFYIVSNSARASITDYNTSSNKSGKLNFEEVCYHNGRYIYKANMKTCDDITLSGAGCLAYTINNTCNDDKVDCNSFDYDVYPSPFYDVFENEDGSKDTITKCLVKWNFPDSVFNASINLYSSKKYQFKLSGIRGSMIMPEGDYNLKFNYVDKEGEVVECKTAIIVDACGSYTDPPSDIVDDFLTCGHAMFNYDQFGYSQGVLRACMLNWSVPDSIDISIKFDYGNNSNRQIYNSSNSGEAYFRHLGTDIEVTYSYILSYYHESHGWIFIECDGGMIDCNNDPVTDSDDDGVPDDDDNCINTPNPNQEDTDEDGIGDVCEDDTDGDGIIDDNDNCIYIPNFDQADYNLDGVGDVCEDDNDADNDGIPDLIDNCPLTPNTNQLDADGDGVGDMCEYDTDGDGIIDDNDNCINTPNPNQEDTDEDGIGDVCDEDDDSVNYCNYFGTFSSTVIDENVFVLAHEVNENDIQEFLNTLTVAIENVNIVVDYVNVLGVAEQEYYNLYNVNQINSFSANTGSIAIENTEGVSYPLTLNYQIIITLSSGEEILCNSQQLILNYEEEVDDEIDIPGIEELICGEEYSSPDSNSSTPLKKLSSGDIIYIGGFPMTVSDVTGSSGEGIYSGTAFLPLPFGDLPTFIEFVDLTINVDYVVTAGSVYSMADPSSLNLGEIDVPVLTIGGNYCNDPEEIDYDGDGAIEDPNNNGGYWLPDGTHSETGTNYDPNGFNQDGEYFTGGDHNENGCTAEGVNYENPEEECDPSNPYSGVGDIINDNDELIDDKINSSIEDKLADFEVNIDDLDCAALREELLTSLNAYTDTEEVGNTERVNELVKGDNDQYISSDLVDNFSSAPQKIGYNNSRNEHIVNVEEKHVELYDCEKLLAEIGLYSEAMKSEDIKAEIKEFIISEMQQWTEYQATELFSPDNEEAFTAWIISMIQKYFEVNGDPSIGSIDDIPFQESIDDIFDLEGSSYFATASMDYTYLPSDSDFRDAFDFEFKQGFSEVLGVNRGYILEALTTVEENSTSFPYKAPVQMDGNEVILYMDNLRIDATSGALIDVYAIIEFGQNGKVVLQASDVSFTPSGIQSVTLSLESMIELKLINPAKITINPGTSLSWTCGELSDFTLSADVEICDKYVKPYDIVNKTVMDGNVTFELDAVGSGWMDFAVNLDVDKSFVLTKYPEWAFTLNQLVIDNSINETPSFTPMEGYQSNYVVDGVVQSTWKGFYLEKLRVDLPHNLKNNNPIEAVEVTKALFDDQGASGVVSAEGILTPEQGAVGGWGFGIDRLSLAIIKNNISGFGLDGEIETPLFEEAMKYSGTMYGPGNYSLVVESDLAQPKDMPLFIATASLSSFRVTADIRPESEFLELTAQMTGEVSFNESNSELFDHLGKMPKMEFVDLTIKNFGENKLSFKTFDIDFAGLAKLNFFGFEADFDMGEDKKFGLKTDYATPNTVGIPMGISINFLENMGVVLGGDFEVIGRLDESGSLHKWRYDRIQLNQFCAAGGWSGVQIDPKNPICLTQYDDDEWGKGFRGQGNIILDVGPLNMKIGVISQFGKKMDDKYFFLDALASGDLGVTAGPLEFNGFGGGVSYHMRPEFDFSSIDFSQDFTNIPDVLGETFSGGEYIVDPTLSYSIKGLTLFNLTKLEEVFNGSAFLTVSMKEGGGLDNIQFGGVGKMMSQIDMGDIPVLSNATEVLGDIEVAKKNGRLESELAGLTQKPLGDMVTGYVFLDFDISNKVLNGDFKVFMESAFIKGAGANNEVVNAKLYFNDFSDWFINIGTPKNPCGVKLNALISAEIKAYLDVGTTIPPFTTDHLPDKIRPFVNNNVKISDAFRRSGGGIMFGAGFNMDLTAKAWIGSASVSMGAGFDVMMRKTDTQCVGRSGDVGINGWYAMGQIWAYLEGRLRIAGINIFNAGLYAVLNAQFPNPTYIQGAVKARVKILGIKRSKTIKFEHGELCELEDSSQLEEYTIITNMVPFDGLEGVQVDEQPEVTMSIALGQDVEGGDYLWKISNQLSVSLVDTLGQEVPCEVILSEDKDHAVIRPYYMLTAHMEYTLTASVAYEVFKNGSKLEDKIDEKVTTFVTGDAFITIPESNIEYAYPVPGMFNYYPQEITESFSTAHSPIDFNNGSLNQGEGSPAYIKLKQYQYDLLNQYGESMIPAVHLQVSGNSDYIIAADFSEGNKVKYFIPHDIAKGALVNAEIGFFSPDRIEEIKESAEYVPSEVGYGSNDDYTADHSIASGEFGVGGDSGETDTTTPNQVVIYGYHFRVSEYDSFRDKCESANLTQSADGPVWSSPLSVFDVLEDENELRDELLVESQVTYGKYENYGSVIRHLVEKHGGRHYTESENEKFQEYLNNTGYRIDNKGFGTPYFIDNLGSNDQSHEQDLIIEKKVGYDTKKGEIHNIFINTFDRYMSLLKSEARSGNTDQLRPGQYRDAIEEGSGETYYDRCKSQAGNSNSYEFNKCLIDDVFLYSPMDHSILWLDDMNRYKYNRDLIGNPDLDLYPENRYDLLLKYYLPDGTLTNTFKIDLNAND